LWFPEIFLISLGVAFWITSFDINYALMDRELDRNQGIHSFPAIFGHEATVKLSFALTIGWLACFLVAGFDEFSGDGAFRFGLWIPTVFLSAIVNLYVNTIAVREAIHSEEEMEKFQKLLFRSSMLTGWVLLLGLISLDFSLSWKMNWGF